jgi:DNA helicase-2/ATP-dependent DNA helicase PcrA
MIDFQTYIETVHRTLARRFNTEQIACIEAQTAIPLLIVAGPGSGKTAVLVLRALRHILVDGIEPQHVMVTTFTKKAAKEIRSRLISWGIPIIDALIQSAHASGNQTQAIWLQAIDVNLCRSGTLDSFCQEWLGAIRAPGEPQPIVLEQFAAKILFTRRVFGPVYQRNKDILDPYIGRFSDDGAAPHSQGDAVDNIKSIHDRLVQDLVDMRRYATAPEDHEAKQLVVSTLSDFHQYLRNTSQFDFGMAARHCLDKLRMGGLYSSIDPIRALLIDEYQDTNPLQESIYFELVRQSAGAVTVVGDDDQSLYRFRGATVELFTSFCERLQVASSVPTPTMKYLYVNYRSTPEIVEFFNNFVVVDPAFQGARVTPPKPRIVADRSSIDVPVLGLFRDTKEELAGAIANLSSQIFRGSGFTLPNGNIIQRSTSGGDLGDAVFLSSSVRERAVFRGQENLTFAATLRDAIESRGMHVFNPRGQALREIRSVQRLLGVVAECLDYDGSVGDGLFISSEATNRIAAWRVEALRYMASNPLPTRDSHGRQRGLTQFVDDWKNGRPGPGFSAWPEEWPLLDLLYTLITWFPEFQTDPEHQIYLEAITRCVTQAANVSAYGMNVYHNEPHKARSREAIWRDVFAPIGDRVIDVDEDLLLNVPHDRLNIMTIHQSKGLEFPLVFIDVGCSFSRDHPANRFKRFPQVPSPVAELESHLAPYTDVGAVRTARSALDRTFDDLVRQYYVAYSRAQSALVLCGLNPVMKHMSSIKHVATCWRRDGTWAWRLPVPATKPKTRPPATVNGHPLTEI